MRIARMALLLATVAVTPIPGDAFHDPGYPVVATTVLESGDWVRYELLAQEDAILDVEEVTEAEGVTSVSVADWALYETGRSAGLTRFGGGSGARVVVPTAGVLVEDESEPSSAGFGSATTHFGIAAGHVTVIVGAVANGGSVTVAVVVSGVGLSLLSSAEGTGTFRIDDKGFGPSAHVRGPLGVAEVAADGSATVTTDGPLFAWFVTDHDITSTRYEGPARSETSMTTTGFGWIILNGEPAGEHRFILDLVAGVVFPSWELVGVPQPAH